MADRMLQRRGTAADWEMLNPILGPGEFGYETDTRIVKMGDGVTAWADLDAVFDDRYLPILGKAADSEKLDGLDSTAYLKVADSGTSYLTPSQADDLFLTQAEGDGRYLTPAAGDALFLTPTEGETLFLTQTEGDARYQQIIDSGDIQLVAGDFATGFSQNTSGMQRPTYRRRNGWIHLRGYFTRDTGTRTGRIFTLPAGFRPSYDIWSTFSAAGVIVGELRVYITGEVHWAVSVTTGLNGVCSLVFAAAETT